MESKKSEVKQYWSQPGRKVLADFLRVLTFRKTEVSYKVKENVQERVHLRAEKERTESTMKKQWMRCLAAVSLIAVMGTGTVLKAHEEEMTGKSGGGYFQN